MRITESQPAFQPSLCPKFIPVLSFLLTVFTIIVHPTLQNAGEITPSVSASEADRSPAMVVEPVGGEKHPSTQRSKGCSSPAFSKIAKYS